MVVRPHAPVLTVEEYKRLPETGPRYQLIEGDLFMAPAPDRAAASRRAPARAKRDARRGIGRSGGRYALPLGLRQDDGALADAARAALRRALGRRLQKRPMVDVHLLRV